MSLVGYTDSPTPKATPLAHSALLCQAGRADQTKEGTLLEAPQHLLFLLSKLQNCMLTVVSLY